MVIKKTGLTSNPKYIECNECGKKELVTVDENGYIDSSGEYFGQKSPPICCGEPMKEMSYIDDKSG